MKTTQRQPLEEQRLVLGGATLEDEVYERVVYGGALSEEAW